MKDGCDGLLDQPPPGAPTTVADEDVARVVARPLETLPHGATQRSRKLGPAKLDTAAVHAEIRLET